jgi:putative endopeptidase
VAGLHAAGVPVLFGFDALRDADTGQPRASFYPSGLGMPGPGYYDAGTAELKPGVDAYRAYLAAQLKFAGVADAKAGEQADWAFAIEQSLVKAMAEDGHEGYVPAQLGKSYSNLFLPDLMQAVGWAPANITVLHPAFFHALDKQWSKPSIAQWQAYLRAQIMHSLAPARGTDPRLPYLAALRITGNASMDRVDRLTLLALAEGADLSSAAFAEAYLSNAQQQKAQAIAEALRAAMGRAIDASTWLSEAGKTSSRNKLSALRLSIGEPSEPIEFSSLHFERSSLASNLLALRRWNLGRSLARLNSAVWPAPVYQWQPVIGYQPSQNRLVVSAAVLNAPVFEGKSTAADYGALGALVGQQMSLAFADYTDADGRGLAGRQAGLVDQYAAYAATPTTKVNATRMLRQNAADLAAIELSWSAFNAQGAADAEAKKNFFRAWAAVWARQDNPAALADSQQTGAFSPARWRVNGPLVNTPAFAQTFACKPGQAMFKPAMNQQAIWR